MHHGSPKTPRRRVPRAAAVVPPAAALVAAAAALAACDSGPPTFAEDVAPILYGNCAGCHRPGGPAPFTLLSWEDASQRAALIADVTGRRFMPPWLPAPTEHAFAGDRRLPDDAIETLRRWAEAGAPRGDPAAEPDPPTWESGWALGEPDLVVEMADTFEVAAGGGDVFRNFVLPLPADRTRYVRAVELRPGNTKVVHHAVMSVDETPYSRLAEAREPGPGFGGMESGSKAGSPGGFFLGWTPGRVPAFNPPGTAWELRPGTDLVLQMHLRPTGQPEKVAARVGVYLTDQPPDRIPLLLRLGGQTLDIPAGESEYVVLDEFTLPTDVRVLGLYPHAHYLGKSMLLEAHRPGGEVDTLIHIPEWDFNWQDAYRFVEPVELPAGTELRMRYVYDNSATNPQNPHHPPERVTLGYESTDEMAELHMQVEAPDPAARETLQTALGRKSVEDQVEAWRHMLIVDPTDAEAHFGLGTWLQANGRLFEATNRYRQALASMPDHPQAHYNLGIVLEARDSVEQAMEQYRAALRIFPEYANAHNNLGRRLALQGRTAEARRHLEAAVEVEPTHADARNNLGNLLRQQGDLEGAATHYRAATTARPELPQAWFNLAAVELSLGRPDAAVETFERGARVAPDALQPHLAMAWSLATSPDASRRRPEAALRLAERAVAMEGGRHPLVLDVLAAALAASGRFDEAVAMAARAQRAAVGDPEMLRRVQAHAEAFRAGEAWVEAGGGGG